MARAGALFLACAFASIALTAAACAVAHAQEASGAISELRLSSAVPGELAVDWEPPSPAPVDYRVDWARSDEEFRSYTVDEGHLYPAGTVSGVSISGLLAGVEYRVRVRARYGGWSGPWSEARLTVSGEPGAAVRSQTPTAPGAPTVTAAAASATTLTINWSAPADGGSPISSYELRYIESEAPERADERWTLQRSLAAGALLETVLTGLTDGVSYDIQVRAVNAAGDGPWSATHSAETTDHGDARGEATPLALETSLPGRINQAGDLDVFAIEAPRAALLTVSSSGAAGVQGTLTTSAGEVLVSSSGSLTNSPRQFSLSASVEAGTYYLTVGHAFNGTGSYLLHAATTVASHSRSDLDPNDATVIELDSYVDGWIPVASTSTPSSVLFTFTLDEPTEVWIHSSGSSHPYLDLRAELLTADDSQLEQSDNAYHFTSLYEDFMFRRSLDAGTYFIRVTHQYASVEGSFRVHLRTVTEPGSTAATATPLPFHTVTNGRIASATDQDFFQLTLDSRRHVLILATAFEESKPLDIEVFEGDTQLDLFTANQAHHVLAYPRLAGFVRDWLDAGTYIIRVSAPEGSAGVAYIIESSPDDVYAAAVAKCLQLGMQHNAQSVGESVDPLSGCQWHLNNTGQYGDGPGYDINVASVWETTKGEGINIAVVDTELQADHYDLGDSVDLDLSHNLDSLKDNVALQFGSIGTAYTGVIAAEHNDIGVRGVAPESTILFNGGIHWRAGETSESELVAAMLRNLDVVAVSNNSWGGYEDDNIRRSSAAWDAALDRGVTDGFGGNGVLYVFTGGSHLDYADDANLNGRSNSYAATTVCGVGYNDKRLTFGNRGATLWLCAPANHIATTNYGGRYLFDRAGAGFATAIVSGVAALIRATNEDLTWRDVKLILAASARWNDQSSSSWQSGAAKYGAPGNYRFSHDYGFGVVDAGAAVELANTWTKLPPMKTFEASSPDARQTVPDAPPGCCFGPIVTSKVTIDPYIEFVEFVELHIEFDHPSFRDMRIELVSPSGTVSTILSAAYSTRINTRFYPHALRSSARFGSARHLGEDPAGEWTLRLTDRYHERSGDLVSWRLKIYGHDDLPDRPTVTSAVAGMRTLTIGWAAPDETGSGEVTSYDLRYIRSRAADKSDDNWTVVGVGASDSDTYQMTNLGPGARYDVQVRAVTNVGAGPWSLTYEAQPSLELPWAPTNVELLPRHLGLDVFWQPPAEDGGADVSRYDLRYIRTDATDKADDNWTPVVAWNTGDRELRYNIPSLLNGTSYDVQLQAHTSEGESPWSTVVAAEPRLLNVDAAINRGTGGGGGGPSGPTPSDVDFEWNVTRDIEELDSDHDSPTGLWSDGETLWIAENGDGADDAVYAYDLSAGERAEDSDFELDERNRAPRGVWSDRSVVWVSDSGQERLFAYDLATGERLEEREFALAERNSDARGIWSDEATMWVLDGRAGALFAYDFESGELLGEYALDSANDTPHGIWSDRVTVWVSDHGAKRLFAYRLPAPEGPAAEDAEPQDLERVRDEEFPNTVLSRASNNSPRGIWSDGDVMYVADESDDKVYSYNMPDAIDARLASLTLSGIDIGEFSPGRTDYEAVVADGVTETAVEAEALQRRTAVVIDPPDADGDDANGYQVALRDLSEITVTVTVTSQDGSRSKTYRVRFPETGWDPARDPWPHCLRGAVSEGLSLVVYEGGSVEELVSCAESRGIAALYALHEGVYLSYILGAPGFVNRGFVATFGGGVPPVTPLVVRSDGPPSPDPFGDDLEGDGRQPWPECLRGPVAAGLSLVVYEGGSREELVVCARSMDITALYALQEGVYLSYILGAPAFVNQSFRDVFAGGLPFMTPLVARSKGPP